MEYHQAYNLYRNDIEFAQSVLEKEPLVQRGGNKQTIIVGE